MTTDTRSQTTRKPTKAQQARAAREAEAAARAAVEQRRATNDRARRELRKGIRSITQGEWLSICRQLDLSRDTIADDDNLVLLAVAWVREKRKHGTASFDVLLELTDRELMAFHGFDLAPVDDDDDEDAGGDAEE